MDATNAEEEQMSCNDFDGTLVLSLVYTFFFYCLEFL